MRDMIKRADSKGKSSLGSAEQTTWTALYNRMIEIDKELGPIPNYDQEESQNKRNSAADKYELAFNNWIKHRGSLFGVAKDLQNAALKTTLKDFD